MLIAEIKATFRSIDTNGDGRLSIKEFKEAANKMGQNVTTKQVKEMFKLVDDNGEQYSSYTFFASFELKILAANKGVVNSLPAQLLRNRFIIA